MISYLEQVLAEMVSDHDPQASESAHALAGDLEGDVEQAEGHQSHRIGMLLVVRIEERNENPEDLLNRCETERLVFCISFCSVAIVSQKDARRPVH